MTIFAVYQMDPSGEQGTLKDAVLSHFPSDSYEVGTGFWLISADVTAKALSDKLGITQAERGSGLVVEVGSYFGRANPAIWTWIKTKWEGAKVG